MDPDQASLNSRCHRVQPILGAQFAFRAMKQDFHLSRAYP
jgi:hypothetical protein